MLMVTVNARFDVQRSSYHILFIRNAKFIIPLCSLKGENVERMYFSEVIMLERTLDFMRIAIKKHGEHWVVGVGGKYGRDLSMA